MEDRCLTQLTDVVDPRSNRVADGERCHLVQPLDVGGNQFLKNLILFNVRQVAVRLDQSGGCTYCLTSKRGQRAFHCIPPPVTPDYSRRQINGWSEEG